MQILVGRVRFFWVVTSVPARCWPGAVLSSQPHGPAQPGYFFIKVCQPRRWQSPSQMELNIFTTHSWNDIPTPFCWQEASHRSHSHSGQGIKQALNARRQRLLGFILGSVCYKPQRGHCYFSVVRTKARRGEVIYPRSHSPWPVPGLHRVFGSLNLVLREVFWVPFSVPTLSTEEGLFPEACLYSTVRTAVSLACFGGFTRGWW